MLRAVVFDLDQTLIDRNATMRRFLLAQHSLFPELRCCQNEVFANLCLQFQNNGYADKRHAYALACAQLGVLGTGLAQRLFDDFKQRYGADPVIFSGVDQALKILSKKYCLGLVSNGRTKVQEAKLAGCGIAPLFSSVCISESMGCKKPEPAIFLACLNELAVEPHAAVFVGDNPSVDIAPAKALGMRAIWVKNDYFSAPTDCDGVIADIAELPPLLEQWRNGDA